jgi:hypothetical protein
MEFLILIVVAVVSFVWGWNTRERVAMHHTNKLLEDLMTHAVQEEKEQLIRIKIEKHEGNLYAYHYENSSFIAQASDRKELEKKLAEKYPGKRFGCTEDNLKEIGFTS